MYRIKGFLFKYLPHSIFYINAITVSRKFYELILVSIQFGRISGYFQYPVTGQISGNSNPVSGRIKDIKKSRLSGGISGASLVKII
jgi:hypothetical protein